MHTTTPASPAATGRNLLINPQFARLWLGQSISAIGDALCATSLALWIFTDLAHGRSWAPLAVSAVLLAAALPDLLIGPLAGVFVDRWDRRRTMLGMDAMRAALIAILALVAIAGASARGGTAGWTLGAVYAAVFLVSVCSQFFGPARMAALADLVPEADRARAAGMSQVAGSVTAIIGPPLAAALFFTLGAGPAILLDGLSFVASFVAIASVRIPPPERRSASAPSGFRRELAEGLRFVAGNRILRTVLISVMLAMLGGGALNALDIFFLTQNLHAPAHLFGLLDAGLGAGVLVGAILSGVAATRLGVARTFWGSLVALGLLILIYARLTSFAPALALLFVVGVFEAALNVVVSPLVLNATPRALIGRVIAVIQPAISLASLLSLAGAGYLAGSGLRGFHAHWLGLHWGAIDIIFTATGVLIVAAGLYAAARLEVGMASRSVPDAAGATPSPA